MAGDEYARDAASRGVGDGREYLRRRVGASSVGRAGCRMKVEGQDEDVGVSDERREACRLERTLYRSG